MSHKLVAFSDSIEKWPTLLLILDLGMGMSKYTSEKPALIRVKFDPSVFKDHKILGRILYNCPTIET